ncbi:MAG: Dam family site-specific DNA-(adenine-N6)-methyltransferase [Candidatus Aenigmarchaeota archaeon]|nr:Dam family site-specific DNA-(adenine-N6)-methyltransferase [Candidatus Aenigmarchaeota archaeon]
MQIRLDGKVNGTRIPQPFLKWAGGKRNLINEILGKLPEKFNNYHEPFIGGGAVFFAVGNKANHSTISDSNLELIMTFKVIQKNPKALIEKLKIHASKHSEKYFSEIRGQEPADPIDIASRMIYLNKTCYNGLYRTNKNGKFNVPFGKNNSPNIVQEENILSCHEFLKDTKILFGDFETINPQKGDFVYLDPPYHPTGEMSFTKYTKENFTERDQLRLRDFIARLTKNGVFVMLSNSNTKFINDLYGDKKFKKDIVLSPRFINCKPNERNEVEELLITNYQL